MAIAHSACTILAATGALWGSAELKATANPALIQEISAATAPWVADATRIAQQHRLSDGVYLYGQSAEPEVVGQAYMVFEVRDRNLIGAFYMPRSSFDCFYGRVENQELALTIVNTYDRTEYSYAVGIDNAPVASSSDPAIDIVRLEGFESIATVSDNDRRILNVCKDNYQDRVGE